MTVESLPNKEKINPNQILNGAVSFYILKAVEAGLFKQKSDTKIGLGVIEHLAHDSNLNYLGKLPSSDSFISEKNLVLELGELALKSYSDKKDIKELTRGRFDPRLIAYAPQALLVYSYLPLLSNLKDIAHGVAEYGLGKKYNRLQPHNSFAAGEMMKPASKKIADRVTEIVQVRGIQDNFAILELGCGNASFSAATLLAFKEKGIKLPQILATDIDPQTQSTAKALFEEKGLLDSLQVMKVDMGDVNDLEKAAHKLEGKKVLVHIGYILHEHRTLAKNTLNAITKVFDNKNSLFAFSEYYYQEQMSSDVPLWFQTIHQFTQDLFDREELTNFVQGFGLAKSDELVHNTRKDNGQITNSTTFWERA